MIAHLSPAASVRTAAVLSALADRPRRTSAEIVDETRLLPLAVRSALRDLADRDLVRRTGAGAWQLTVAGAVEATRTSESRPR